MRMFFHFRHQIVRLFVIGWLAIMLASVLMWAFAWNRLSDGIEASATAESQGLLSATAEATRQDLTAVYRITWLAGLLGLGTAVFAVYFYRVDYHQEKAQRKLLQEKLDAEDAVKEKSAFLANMSHEIRTPMNAILGFSELLEPEGLTPKQSQYVRAIRDSGAALLQLINDILDLSKIEAGRLELHPDPTDLRDSCAFLRTVFGEQAVRKSLQLYFELAPDLPPALLLDRLRLRQVLVNLLGNAVKFTEHGSVRTRVSWQSHPGGSTGTLLIDVEDTGIGIPRDKLREIFRSFVQADSGRGAETHGTGLGLTIARRLTEMMNGTLTVESKEGWGSVFHLSFSEVPVSARLSVGDHAEPEGAVDFDDFAPATLLVVDDNKVNRYLMLGMFEKTHHRLHFAANGKEALQRLDEFKFDAVLLDIRMPIMDGPTTLTEIRKRPELASMPVVAISASSKASEDAELRSRFSAYIRKPFARQTLFAVLAQFLQRVPHKVSPAVQNPSGAVAPALNPPPERLAQWQDLVLELRTLEESSWPALHATLAINETRSFAQKLRAQAYATQCGLLTNYAATLLEFADAYAVGAMEGQLAKFPKLVDTIAGACAQS
jgi:signal transduction histidine kinase/CheY-like chemotaxis protein